MNLSMVQIRIEFLDVEIKVETSCHLISFTDRDLQDCAQSMGCSLYEK